ncbi:MAG TPA: GNAT family N-acetyltransferase [Firmicutes bacterium]|nr:GNAT family N-acetyltransferase [Bacillota bacterium]
MTEIRTANEKDVPDILYITKEAFKKYAADLGQPEKVMALKENEKTILDELKRKTILLGFYDGKAVGAVRFEKIPGNLAYITRFGVLPEAQKCGMGRKLISEVCARCAQEGITAVALHTCTKMFPLVRFYYGQGFYIHSTTQDRGYVRGLFLKELTSQTHETMDLTFVSKL